MFDKNVALVNAKHVPFNYQRKINMWIKLVNLDYINIITVAVYDLIF